jgi:hypothetical protein
MTSCRGRWCVGLTCGGVGGCAAGAATVGEERILVMGATNLPWALDEAVLRRWAHHAMLRDARDHAQQRRTQRLDRHMRVACVWLVVRAVRSGW